MNMLFSPMFWLEIAIVAAFVGGLCAGLFRNPLRAWRVGLVFAAAALACSLAACIAFYYGRFAGADVRWSLWHRLFGWDLFIVDELGAPLLPLVALMHFLTALATGRTNMRGFSLSWSLTSEAIGLATFGTAGQWWLVSLLIAGVLPAYVELVNRGKPTRVYLFHMTLFIGLLVLGSAGIDASAASRSRPIWAIVALLAAILIRCGAVPVHCWLPDWFEHASFGNALLFVTPLTGVYAAIRLVLPIAPDWIMRGIGLFSLATAMYAAGMSLVQKDTRRFFAYLFLSHASLVLVGLELNTVISLTGALALWVSTALSLAGLGLTLRALEARFSRLSLQRYHGLFEQTPTLAVCFLITGLASIGFPGTLGFVATELLVEGAIEANLFVGLAVALTAAINGIAVVRVYFLLFTGARHVSTVSLGITTRERFAVLTLATLIFAGGLVPQPGISSRFRAATSVLRQRERLQAAKQAAVRYEVVETQSSDD